MADLDVLTAAEGKRALHKGQIDVEDEELLAVVITAMSRRLDEATGPVVRRTVTDELHDGGMATIWLRRWPVTSISSLSEFALTTEIVLTAETNADKPASGYLADAYEPDDALLSGQVWRRSGGYDSCFARGRKNVRVTYMAGRFADTASVDARFKEAAGIILRNWWRGYQESVGEVGEFDVPTANYPRFAIPNAAKELLSDEWQAKPGFA